MKGQAEIIGLVVIAVILVLGFVFFLSFQTRTSPVAEDQATTSQKAQSTLSSLLQTKSTCGRLDNMIRDCFEQKDVCPGTDPCYYARSKLGTLLNTTLPDNDAVFTAELEDEDFSVSTRGCSLFQENKGAAVAFIPSEKGTIKITLSVCR